MGGRQSSLESVSYTHLDVYKRQVVREEALKKYPDLEKTLMLMNGILSDQEMAELNYQVEVDGKDEAVVAKDFLIKKGLIEMCIRDRFRGLCFCLFMQMH